MLKYFILGFRHAVNKEYRNSKKHTYLKENEPEGINPFEPVFLVYLVFGSFNHQAK